MHSDNEIRTSLLAELQYEPSLRNDDIAIAVRDGVVTLGGFVDSLADKVEAERVAGHVKGVRGVANELQVKLPAGLVRSDTDLARAALDALRWHIAVPHEQIRVTVEKGWVTLDGVVDLRFQKDSAESAVRYLIGVAGVSNRIALRPQATPRDIRKRIKSALHRAVELDAERIQVEIAGTTLTLAGTVCTWAERQEAERAARRAPGAFEILNHINVSGRVPAAV